MTVNGVARWTCRTHVAKVAKGNAIEIAPLFLVIPQSPD